MSSEKPKIQVKVDSYTRACLTAIAILLSVLIVGLWAEAPSISPDAIAGEVLFDSGAQRNEIVDVQKEANKKLGELIKLLKSGEVRVQLIEPAERVSGVKNHDIPKGKK